MNHDLLVTWTLPLHPLIKIDIHSSFWDTDSVGFDRVARGPRVVLVHVIALRVQVSSAQYRGSCLP